MVLSWLSSFYCVQGLEQDFKKLIFGLFVVFFVAAAGVDWFVSSWLICELFSPSRQFPLEKLTWQQQINRVFQAPPWRHPQTSPIHSKHRSSTRQFRMSLRYLILNLRRFLRTFASENKNAAHNTIRTFGWNANYYSQQSIITSHERKLRIAFNLILFRWFVLMFAFWKLLQNWCKSFLRPRLTHAQQLSLLFNCSCLITTRHRDWTEP